MSKKKKNSGYRGVEHQNIDTPFSRPQQFTTNPFKIVGDAKPSKTGKSLSMRIKHDDGVIHHYTIAIKDIERMFFLEENQELIPASIREYFNELSNQE